jgi:hypothetical protein
VKWRRAHWWLTWQAWLFFHPPDDREAIGQWAWGRLGFFLVGLGFHVFFWTSVAIVIMWARWAFDL